jgi:hypothetical protein
MRVVWKTVLAPIVRQVVRVPTGAEIIHVAEQGGHVCMWYLCDESAPLEDREVAIAGTGHAEVQEDWTYLGTAMMQGGRLVLHAFEVRR